MTEQEDIDRLTKGFIRLNDKNRHYFRDLSQQLFYVQYPPVNPSFDKNIKVKNRKDAINKDG